MMPSNELSPFLSLCLFPCLSLRQAGGRAREAADQQQGGQPLLHPLLEHDLTLGTQWYAMELQQNMLKPSGHVCCPLTRIGVGQNMDTGICHDTSSCDALIHWHQISMFLLKTKRIPPN